MNKVNELVHTIQQNGEESAEYNVAYAELFEEISRTIIEPKVDSFSLQLRGEVAEGYAVGADLLVEFVQTWNGTGKFTTWFRFSLENRLINLAHSTVRDVRSHNTSYSVSLSEEVDNQFHGGEAIAVIESLTDASLTTTIEDADTDNPLEYYVKKFEEENPKQAGLIDIILNFHDDMHQTDKTNAFCVYYGVQKYTPAIQKRVSRVRESFKNFLIKNDYELLF